MALNTYSEITRQPLDEEEAIFIANNNEIASFVFDNYADVMRSINPNLLRFSYNIYRQINDGVRDEWLDYASGLSIDPEQGFVHVGGVRADNTSPNPWMMRTDNHNYRNFQVDRTIKLLKNVWYGGTSDQASVPWEGYLHDLTLFDPSFDPLDLLANADEYDGEALTYEHPYIQSQVTMADAVMQGVLSEWPTTTPRYAPNLGDMTSSMSTDVNTASLYDLISWWYVQVTWSHDAADSKIFLSRVDSFLDNIDSVLADGKRFLGSFYDTSGTAGAKTAKGQKLAAVLFLLVQDIRLYARYFTDLSQGSPNRVNDFEYNPIMRTTMLGDPTSNRVDLAQGGRLKGRTFENGMVLLYVKEFGGNPSDPYTYTLPQAGWIMDEDGHLSDQITEITMNSNEGAVIIFDIEAATEPPYPTPIQTQVYNGQLYTGTSNFSPPMRMSRYKTSTLPSVGLTFPGIDRFTKAGYVYKANMSRIVSGSPVSVFSDRVVQFELREDLTSPEGDETPVIVVSFVSGDFANSGEYVLQARAHQATAQTIIEYFPKVYIDVTDEV